jgi:diadenosine tetraphosphate (Ap4A) HIT family hydrolase
MNPKELAGLLVSIGIRKLPGFMPFIVLETDKTIVIRHPFPLRTEKVHYIIAPKIDIKNIGEISKEDIPYLIDAHAVARDIIEREKLYKYRLYTNGPGVQHVAYLHFHLIER